MANLNETISEIKETFADIRTAIIEKGVEVGECESPTVYDDKIRAIQSRSDGIALSSVTAEAYSAYGNPTADVTYNEGAKSMHFKFGLIRGDKGDKGDKGDPGAVGSAGVPPESIYTRRPDINNEDIEAPISVNEDGDVPEGWTPNPQGVTHDLQVEYVSTRRKVGNNGSDGSTPAVGSLWGEMGRDGNGLEYIYCLTKDSINVPQVPYSDPDKSESDLIDQFPLKAGGYEGTDDPQSVTVELNTCWVSVRKQSYDVENNQKWGPYSPPAVGAKFGKDGKEGGGRTIFVYTVSDKNVTSVPTPTGGEGDPETNGVVVPEDSEGVYIGFTNPPEDSDGKKLGLSTATFNSSGTKLQDWCTPYCLTGEDGINGTDGQSIQFIYRLIPNKDNFDILRNYHETSGKKLTSDPTGNDVAPEKIDKLPIDDNTTDKRGGEVVNEEYYTITDTEGTDEPRGIGEVDGKLYSIECVCIRTKTDEGWSEGSMPLLGSVGGEDGIDGAGVEYIYKITPEYDESGDKIDLVIPPVEGWENPDDSYPDGYNSEITKEEYGKIYNTLEFVPSGEWLSKHGYTDEKYKVLDEDGSDEPRDVSPEEPLEGVSIRRQHLNEDTGKLEWGSFSEPKIWNRFVHDGTAFKTQYVFIRNNGTPPTIPEGAGTFDMFDDGEPFKVKYTDEDGNETTYTWYDGIPSENPELPLGMSKRTFRASDVQEFDYDNSLETSEEEQRQEGLNSLFDKDWDAPILMTDTSKMQIEYYHPNKVIADLRFENDDEKNEYLSNSPDDNNHEPTSLNDYYSKYLNRESDEQYQNSYEIDGRNFDPTKDTLGEYTGRNDNKTGSDEADVDVYYMAISILKTDSNGKQTGSDWDIVRIKGERGDAGRDGTSVKILGSAAIVGVIPENQYSSEEGKLYKYILVNKDSTYKSYMGSDSGYESYIPTTGDGFLIKHATENYTELWSYDGDSGENCGKFSGEDGDTAKIYIRFSNSSNGNPMLGVDDNGVPVPGKYIGIYATKYTVDDNSYSDYSNYSGSKGGGDDGGGYEQIFLLTTNKYNDIDPLPIPSAAEGDNVSDYCPIHGLDSNAFGGGENGEKGSDRPLTPTPDYPICGTVTRKASGNTFGPWKGVNEHGYGEGDYASIYQKYYYPNVEMSLSNDQAVVPLDIDGNIDSDFDSYLTTAIQLYSGNESVIATENFPVTISVEGLTLNNDVTVGGKTHINEQWEFTEGSGGVLSFPVSAISGDKVSITVEYGYQSIAKEFRILKTDAAWEIFPDQSVLFRDPNTGYFTQEKLTGNIKKGVDNKWMNIDEGRFTWSYISGGSTSDGNLDTSENGEFEIDLSKLSNVESIRITVNDKIFEDIPVYANGRDGEAGITYRLDINPSQIKIDKDGNVSDHQITATAYLFVGSNPPEEYINGKIKYSIDDGSEIEYTEPITTYSLVKNDSVEFKLYDSEANYLGVSQTVSIMRDSKPTFSVNASTPTIGVDSEEETPISDTCNINVSAYFENDLKYISNASAKRSVNGGAFESCTCTNNKIYLTLSVPDEKVTECKYELDITFEDGNTWNGEVNCDILKRAPKGNDAVSPIAVHLSNPSMELSGFANGDVALNSSECTITAVKENNPVAITVDNNIESGPFEVTVEDNNTEKVVIRVSSANKIADGLYHVDIPITIESENITRVIYITVKEIPNVDTDVIMDQSINVVYAKKTTEDTGVGDWGNLMSGGGAVVEKIEGKTYYYEKFAGIKNIYAKQNGVLVNKDSLEILSINIGETSLNKSTGEGKEGHYGFDGENLTFSVINLMKILQEQTITEGMITFDVNGVSVNKKVLFNTNRTAYKRDVQLFPKEVNYGETVEISLNVRQGNTDGSGKEEPGDNYTYFNIYKGNEKLIPINGKLTFQNVTEDIELSFKGEYDESEELCDIQTISCVKQPVLDKGSIKANTPFVKVTHNAIVGSGELVGNPISLTIQHQIGDSITSYNDVPDGYTITYSCTKYDNSEYSESISSGELSFNDEELFTTINPVSIELKKDNAVIDSVTIEKTIVYPEPIIYPAGEYASNKSYNISYSQVPYIFVKTSGEIKYYVGNRDILTGVINSDLKDTITIDGKEIKINTVNGFPAGNSMESFEAIYADIGVFRQALVGPMVFYKDYVFSQMGTNTSYAWGDPPGEECLYDVAISELEAIGYSSDDLFDHGKPNYLLNAKTGKLSLYNKSGEATVALDDGIQMDYNDTVGSSTITRTTSWHPRTGLNLQYSNKTIKSSGESVPVINIENVTDKISSSGGGGNNNYKNTAPPIVVNAKNDSGVSIESSGIIRGGMLTDVHFLTEFENKNGFYWRSGNFTLPALYHTGVEYTIVCEGKVNITVDSGIDFYMVDRGGNMELVSSYTTPVENCVIKCLNIGQHGLVYCVSA